MEVPAAFLSPSRAGDSTDPVAHITAEISTTHTLGTSHCEHHICATTARSQIVGRNAGTHQEFDDVGSHHLITIWFCPKGTIKTREKKFLPLHLASKNNIYNMFRHL